MNIEALRKYSEAQLLGQTRLEEAIQKVREGILCFGSLDEALADAEENIRRYSKSDFQKAHFYEVVKAEVLKNQDAAVAAIEYSLRTDEGMEFLRCWMHGDFDAIRKEWPDAPEAVFIGADPLLQPVQHTSVLGLVAAERKRQDDKWGGAAHDDQHSTASFVQLIEDYAGWARTMAGMNSPAKARNRLIQVAALAVAAVESIDRTAALNA